MDRIKVLYVHHSGFFGGASNSLLSVIERLPKEELDIYIICPSGNVIPHFERLTPNIRKFSVPAAPTFFPSAEGVRFTGLRSIVGLWKNRKGIQEVHDYIREIQPDIVHFNESIFVPVLRNLPKGKYSVVAHARSKPGNRRSLFDRIGDYYLNKYTDLLLCINQSVLLGFIGVTDKRVLKNPLQFSLEKRNLLETSPSRTIQEGPINCLFLSNLFDFKGIKETIESAIALKNENIHFYIAGSAPRGPEFFNSPLGRFVNFTGLYPNLEGYIDKAIADHQLTNVHKLGHVGDIESLFQLCHINLAPVWLDAPPRSVFEAGAYGIPTILALEHKTDDIIEDGINGILIDPKNVQQLSNAILLLKANPELYQSMSEAVRKSSLIEHDPQNIASQLLGVYKKLLAKTA